VLFFNFERSSLNVTTCQSARIARILQRFTSEATMVLLIMELTVSTYGTISMLENWRTCLA